VLDEDTGDPVTYFTFDGNYDSLIASGQMEIKRAMIYNYLLNIGMPMTSDMTIWSGE
jgi:hypothetical protein